MKKSFLIIGLAFLFFVMEYFIFNFIHPWITPNFLLLLVIFVNLTLGIRFSLLTAVVSGVFRDSFSTGYFGVNLFSFIFCSYMTTLLGKYIYHRGSNLSRLLLVFIICIFYITIHGLLSLDILDIIQALKYIYIPEIISTLVVATYTFHLLKKCVLKLFVHL